MTKDIAKLQAIFSLSDKQMRYAEELHRQNRSIEDCIKIVSDRVALKGLRKAVSKSSVKISELTADNKVLLLENARLESELNAVIKNTKALKLSSERLSSERGRWIRKLKRAGLL